MGILRLHETENAEIEEFRRMLLSCAAGHRRKDGDDLRDNVPVISGAGNEDVLEKLVCVTSGVSYLGIAIVNQLLVRGYSVRIIVDNEGLVLTSKDFTYFFHSLIFYVYLHSVDFLVRNFL